VGACLLGFGRIVLLYCGDSASRGSALLYFVGIKLLRLDACILFDLAFRTQILLRFLSLALLVLNLYTRLGLFLFDWLFIFGRLNGFFRAYFLSRLNLILIFELQRVLIIDFSFGFGKDLYGLIIDWYNLCDFISDFLFLGWA
jgi:hypothetical protein